MPRKKQKNIINPHNTTCNTPREFYKTFTLENGDTIRRCPKCYTLEGKEKKCLSCNKTIKPTCAYTHLCQYCAERNKRESNTFERNRSINTEL